MDNEQTDTSVDTGTKPDKALAKDGENLSDYDKALELVKRREEATKAENETLDRKEKLAANTMLGGTAGGHIESTAIKEESNQEYRRRITKEMAEGKTDFGN